MKRVISSKWSIIPTLPSGMGLGSPHHGPGKLSTIQPHLEELFGARISLDNSTLGVSCSCQLFGACSEVIFAAQSLPCEGVCFTGSRVMEDFTRGATEVEMGSATWFMFLSCQSCSS